MENNKITIGDKFEEELKHQQEKHNKAKTKRVQKILAVILLIIGVCVYAVEEWRVGVINFFEDIEYAIRAPIEQKREEEFMKKQLEGDPIKSYSGGGITMNYIPDGYCLTYEKIKKAPFCYTTLSFTSKNGDSNITFDAHKLTPNYQSSIDTEDAVVTEFEENGYKVIKSIKDRVQILKWYNNEYAYTLIFDIGEEDLIKMAKNLDFKNFE